MTIYLFLSIFFIFFNIGSKFFINFCRHAAVSYILFPLHGVYIPPGRAFYIILYHRKFDGISYDIKKESAKADS